MVKVGIVVAPLLLAVEGMRVVRKPNPQFKAIAGVPVLNYENAFDGQPSLSDLEEEWVVVVKPDTSDEQIAAMCKSNRKGCKLVGHPSKGGVPFLELRGTEGDLERVILTGQGAAKYIELDHEMSIPELEAPELEADDVESSPWGLDRVGTDRRGRGRIGATIFVLDTGVRSSHADFGGRAASALDMSSGQPVECNGDVRCAGDAQGHGTHCAGTAGGRSYGVAPLAAVKGVKVLGDSGSGSAAWSYSALDWLAQSRTRPAVASMSLGGRTQGTGQGMKDAIDAAVSSGVVVVVAGGNSNRDACWYSPAFVPSAITVGSTTSTDTRSSFSNYGKCTNMWAPGSEIVSASSTSDTGTRTLSGTSMACPHVSGAAALLLANSPRMRPAAVLAALTKAAARQYIKGLKSTDVNLLLNVDKAGPPPPGRVGPGPDPPKGSCESFCQKVTENGVPGCNFLICSGCSFCSR